ncbi:MAG: hypothetical protein U0903_05885 [Planctomycetales bacterium]
MNKISMLMIASVFVSYAAAGERDEAYKRLQAMDKQAQAMKVKQQEARNQLMNKRGQLKQAKQSIAAGKAAAQNQAQPSINYDNYDMCPNGHPWDDCNHEEEKAEWLRRQTDAVYRFQKNMEKILDDFRERSEQLMNDILGYKDETKDYESKNTTLKGVNKDISDLKKDLPFLADNKPSDQLSGKLKDIGTKMDGSTDKYQAGDGTTKCNLFLQDYANELLDGADVKQLNGSANDICKNLAAAADKGEDGIYSIDIKKNPLDKYRQSLEAANQGDLVVNCKPAAGHGHVNVTLPGAKLSDRGVPYVAQAGSSLSRLGGQSVFTPSHPVPLSETFSKTDRNSDEFRVFVIPNPKNRAKK